MFPTQFLPRFAGSDNSALDALFYDVEILSREERQQLVQPGKVEGMILEVGPSWEPALRVWPSLARCEGLARRYRAITVAGVGSSAIGAAALARNVADALGEKVLAVVSGHGLGDLASEAMGGFFLFGGVNAMRHGVNSMSRTAEALRTINPWLPAPRWVPPDPAQGFQIARYSKDVKALARLLSREVECDFVVGHSKGNLVISEALYTLRTRHPERFERIAQDITILTFGARIAMPTEMARVIDVMGELDSFGAWNSRPDIGVDVSVPGAWHHTNTRLPYHLPVTRVMEDVMRGEPAEHGQEGR
jgi:hypothetical protein